MRLTRKTEWLLVAALVVYTVFIPGSPRLRSVIGSPVGTAASLLGIYLLAKRVSTPLALVALVAVVRTSSAVLREHQTDMGNCHCAQPGFTFDSTKNMCTKTGSTEEYEAICCADVQIWNDRELKCTTKPGPEGAFTEPLVMTTKTKPMPATAV